MRADLSLSWTVAVVASCLAACGDSGTEVANRAPEVQRPIPDQTLTRTEGAATVDAADHFTDPDGDALTYTVSSTDSGVAAVSVSGSVVTLRPVAARTLTATVTVTAQDPGGLTASLSFAVRVTVVSPDLVVGVSPDTVVGVAGVGFEYVAAVRNEGNAASATTRVRTFMSADSVVTTSDELVGDGAEVPALGPGESASRTASFTVSSSLSAGAVFYVGECVDPVEGELDTGNNCSRAIKVTVRVAPDLVVGVSPDTVVGMPGVGFEYVAAVRNEGNAASATTRVRTFVSADSVVTTSDELVGDGAEVPALGPGESASRTASFTVSSSLSAGAVFYVGECVDPVEGELDTGNNCSRAIKVTVRTAPDLVVDVSPDSVAVAPGGSFEYAVAVRNQGNGLASATKSRTFASSDSVITTSDEEVGEAADVPGLGPGVVISRVAMFTASASASPGTVFWVGECVDAVEEESDAENNCSAAIKVTVTGRPDLVAGVSPDSVAVVPGGSFEYAVRIRNVGDAASVATTVGAFLSADSVVTTSDELVGQASRVPALGAGESVEGTASMVVSRSASPGTVVWVGECVDPVEGESDTDNNCSSAIKVTVLATGGLRAAGPVVAQRPGGAGSGALPVIAAVVGRAGRIEFRRRPR